MSFANRAIGYSATFGTPAPTTWTNRVSPSFGMFASAWNGTNFIVGGAGSTTPTVYSSPDGSTWTSRTIGSMNGSIVSAIWANSTFVVGSAGGYTATSSDGITWSVSAQLASTSYGGSAVNALVYLSSYGFVCAGGSANAAVSTDGATWTYRGGLQTAWGSVIARCGATNGSIYCFGGDSGRIATTTDSVTWTDRNSLRTGPYSTNVVNGMAYGNGRFVVVGGTTSPVTAYSTDGITWTYNGTLPSGFGNIGARCVTWTGTFFVAGMDNGYIATSPDGITWTGITALYNLAGWGNREVMTLTNSNDVTVAGGWESGTSGRIASSP